MSLGQLLRHHPPQPTFACIFLARPGITDDSCRTSPAPPRQPHLQAGRRREDLGQLAVAAAAKFDHLQRRTLPARKLARGSRFRNVPIGTKTFAQFPTICIGTVSLSSQICTVAHAGCRSPPVAPGWKRISATTRLGQGPHSQPPRGDLRRGSKSTLGTRIRPRCCTASREVAAGSSSRSMATRIFDRRTAPSGHVAPRAGMRHTASDYPPSWAEARRRYVWTAWRCRLYSGPVGHILRHLLYASWPDRVSRSRPPGPVP